MPLSALLDGQVVYSFDFNDETWQELKRTYRSRKLLTRCCEQPAVPYKNHLGTLYFQHKVVGDCTTGSETPEHLLAKIEIAKAVRAALWSVETEVRGQTPSGEGWIADVFASKGNRRIAFEIQWSNQPQDRTLARQKAYQASGVRGAWFRRISPSVRNRRGKILEEETTPEFAIRFDAKKQKFLVPRFDLDLKAFVQGMLSGQLKWCGPKDGEAVNAFLLIGKTRCPICSRDVNAAIGLRVSSPEFGDLEDFSISPNAISRINDIIAYLLRSRERLDHAGIGAFERYQQQYQETQGSYVNRCRFCATILHHDRIFKRGVLPEVSDIFAKLILGNHIKNNYDKWLFNGKPGRWKY